ncbi:MAG: hypothetical protein M3Z02_11085 [Actinomycetota bacterium]|nr:hypothetical protein [Actinomycetota bacterium]
MSELTMRGVRRSAPGRAGAREQAISPGRPRLDYLPVGTLAAVAAVVGLVLRRLLTPPLWYDENWRAVQVSSPTGLFHDLSHAVAPSALGWLALERTSVRLLGNTEFALRLPSLLALLALGLVTCRLAGRFLPRYAALALAALVMLNVPLLAYGLAFKPYLVEAAATVGVVELWLTAADRPARWHRLLPCYVGMAALVVLGVPVLFVLPGLYVFDLLRAGQAQRGQRELSRLAMMTAVGLVAGAHYLFYLAPQGRTLAGGQYWSPNYLPVHSGLRPILDFLVFQAVWFVKALGTAGMLPPDTFYVSLRTSSLLQPPSGLLAYLSMLGLGSALLIGIAALLRHPRLRPVPVAVAGALLVQVAVSSRGLWPFGANRTNLFLVPLLAVMVAAGLRAIVHKARLRRPIRAAALLLLVLVLATVPLQVVRLGQLVRDPMRPALQDHLKEAVAEVRAKAGPDDVVFVNAANFPPATDFAGYTYYMYFAENQAPAAGARPPVPMANTAFTVGLSAPQVGQQVAAHPAARHVFVLELWNPFGGWNPASGNLFPEATGSLRASGFCPAGEHTVATTGLLVQLDRC